MIQTLFERIKKLEAGVESLKSSINPSSTDAETLSVREVKDQSDSLIEEFLDGAGI